MLQNITIGIFTVEQNFYGRYPFGEVSSFEGYVKRGAKNHSLHYHHWYVPFEKRSNLNS